MSLSVHRAERTDLLADALGDLLATPLADPFATEVVVVPAHGVERWISQRLSHRLGADGGSGDGVCAGVDFRTPWALIAEITGTRDADPWSPDSLTWPLLAAIDDSLDQPWARTLATHLGYGLPDDERDLRRGRRYATARRLAGLFASYAAQRPTLIEDWSAGRDTDGCGASLPRDLAWQPHLWRHLIATIGRPTPTQRQADVVARLRDDPAATDLPDRLSLFGHTRLSATDLQLLDALATHRDIHLWLPHPSPQLWQNLFDHGADHAVRRRDDDTHRLVGHPLLASLGRDVRELQRSLAAVIGPDRVIDPAADLLRDRPTTLLGWLQHDLHGDQAPADPTRDERVWAPTDHSVQIHACHGPHRQVEVLREVLLGLLADDSTLEPRDIVVMCPDIESYAPLIAAGFGLGEVVGDNGHPAHRLRVRLADRALTQTNPLLDVAGRLLELAGGRATASEVVDLAHAEPVRRRFGFTDDDLDQIATWVGESGVRWAFDAPHRADFGLADVVTHTWQFGLDRILAGATMSADAQTWLDRTLPLDDVGSGQIDLAGRLAEYVARLRSATDLLVGEHPLEHWTSALVDGVASLTDTSADDAWQGAQVQRELGRIAEDAAAHGQQADATHLLRLPDVRALLGRRLAGRPTRANFRTGTLTVCTMVPMRSVPHRVVCLLGMDDGVFPRVGITDGDDVLARDPMTGERDARSEDRQLFLDAILAAEQTLVITYSGADPHTGVRRPPAVPVGELLDAVDRTASAPDLTALRESVVTAHPLQPFDPRNLLPGALLPATPFTFDPAALAGARAAAGDRHAAEPFLAGVLPPVAAEDVALDDVLAFFRHPVRQFLRQRLDLLILAEQDTLADGLPVEIDNLEQWQVGDRVLTDLLRGIDPASAAQQEWRRGALPPGRLGWRTLQDIVAKARPLAAAGLELRTSASRAVDVDVDLGDGRRLRGTVPEMYGDRLVPVSYSRLGATHRLQSWIKLLALAASDDDRNWTAHTLGRPTNNRSRDPVGTSLLGPLDHTALAVLRDLVAVRDRGLAEPLPLPIKTSFGYARMRRTNATTTEALRKAGWDWQTDRFPGEDADSSHVLVWGAGAAIPGLDQLPHPGEAHDGERTRFGALALRVWSPLLVAEQGSW